MLYCSGPVHGLPGPLTQKPQAMYLSFLNPQGNFDRQDSYWTEHADFGGQLVYVKEVAAALAGMGNRVDIVTRQIEDPNWPEFRTPFDAYEGIPGLRIVRIPCGPPGFLTKESLWPHLGTEWVPNIRAFYAQEAEFPDCFTTHYGDGGLCGALLLKKTGIPFTFTGHSLGAQKLEKLGAGAENLDSLDEKYRFSIRIQAERIAMRYARIIFTSTRQERFEQYGHPAYHGAVDPQNEEQFRVVPPGVNLSVFSTNPSGLEAAIGVRIQQALERDIEPQRRQLPLVVSSSRLDPKKNHRALVQAFAFSRELQGSANLAIVVRGLENPLADYERMNPGERAVFSELIEIARQNGLDGKITAFPLNSQGELAAAYRLFSEMRSVFALTPLYEPFGLAPLEAMSCGLPAVVTKNGGPSESLAEDGQAYGILIDPQDPTDIARGLMEILASPETWQAYHRAGLQRVRDQYTWDRTAEGYLKAIESLVRSGADPGEIAIPPYFEAPETPVTLDELSRIFVHG